MIDAFRETGSSTIIDCERSVVGKKGGVTGKQVTIDLKPGDKVESHGWRRDDRVCNKYPFPLYLHLRIIQQGARGKLETILWVLDPSL